ncbi:MAG TPA: tetratricopeptide repeat protein [Vicinamibacterales bacterium]|nr:tetratricopeptide repeat protein [Vicinamibacterales bacterium]
MRRRVQADPASIAFAALAEEYRRAGRFDEAISTCLTGLKRHPSYLSAHVTLGRALIEVDRFDDARDELEFVLRAAPENLAAIRGLAEIHHRQGDVSYPEDDASEDTLPTPATLSASPDPALAALEALLAAVASHRADHRDPPAASSVR